MREVRELIRNRKFHEALAQLKSVDRAVLSECELGELYVLRARAAVFSGSEDNLPRDIDKAIEIFRNGSTPLFSEAKYLRGVWLSKQGRYPEAKQDLVEAHISFVRCGDCAGSATALNRLSYSHLMMGDIDAAIRNLEECTRVYSELDNRKNQVACSQNLCHLYFRAGRLADSVKGFTDVESLVPDLGDRSLIIYHFNCAISLAAIGQVSKARKSIAKCRAHLDDYPREKAIYFENLGLINILDGQHDAAERALTEGLEISLEIAPESSLVSQIKRLFGDLYAAMEQWNLAEQFTREGLEVAEKIGERVEIGACWRIMAQLEQHKGNDEKAREWYHQAVDMMNLIGARYELAVTRYLAGASGLYSNGERTALLYLAREYFESEKVAPYLKRIDKALSITIPVRKTRKRGSVPVPKIIAVNPAMKKLVAYAENISQSTMTVLLTGATGTGKDLFASYIHHCSGRSGEFVSVNAAAIPNEMIEAELFGHTKGAFTGANADRVGLIEQADQGTLYLNEIADATSEFQAKLLEVLETRQIRRLGENVNRPVAFRLIAATNHDLQQRMKDNLFRLDLYHRLNDIPIQLPSLSDRTEDITALVEHFLNSNGNDHKVNGNRKALERFGFLLSIQDNDGNIRELKSRVERLLHVSSGDIERMIELLLSDDSLSECDRLSRVLDRTGWNRREAARRLGVSDMTIRRQIAKYCLLAHQ